MGVSSNAAPSLANTAAMAQRPSRTTSGNSRRPRPPPQRATCSAAHWKKPASSEQQRDHDQADKGEGRVPHDVPDDGNVVQADHAGCECDDRPGDGGQRRVAETRAVGIWWILGELNP